MCRNESLSSPEVWNDSLLHMLCYGVKHSLNLQRTFTRLGKGRCGGGAGFDFLKMKIMKELILPTGYN